VKAVLEVVEQFFDVAVGTLHRRQPAGVLARQRLGAGRNSEMNRYSRMSARK